MKPLAALLFAGLSAAPLSAQFSAPIKLVSVGEPVPGTGQNIAPFTFSSRIRVSDNGSWIAKVPLDGSDPDKNSAILYNGKVLALEGAAPTVPAGGSYELLGDVDVDDVGTPYFRATVEGFPAPSTSRSVIYRKESPILTQLDTINAAGWSSTAYYETILEYTVSGDGTVLVVCRLVDLTVSNQTRISLVRFEVDGSNNRINETVLATKEDILPGQVLGIESFWTTIGCISLNNDGIATFNGRLDPAAGTKDDVIYSKGILVAQSETTSPVPGRDYGSLAGASSDINNNGNVVWAAKLDGSDPTSDEVILLNGNIVAQKGSPTPVSSLTYQSILGSSVFLDESDEPYFLAETVSGIKGLFTDNLILLRTGSTQVQGQTLTDLELDRASLHMSNDGDFAAFIGELDGNEGAMMLLERNIAESYCSAEPNSTGSIAFLLATGSSDASENFVAFSGFNLPPGQFSYLLAAESTADIPMAGGSQGRLCLGSPAARFISGVQAAGAFGTVFFTPDLSAVPLSPSVAVSAGDTWYFQVWYRDVNPTTTSNFTRPICIEFR